jgi:hypothetical protein
VASPEASVALEARGVLEAIELLHRIAALSATELVARAPIVGNVLLWIWLSRWWPFCEQCGARGMPVVRCIGQRGNAFLQNLRRTRSRRAFRLGCYCLPGDKRCELQSFVASSMSPIPSITW